MPRINKILIANRGEIALRIIQTCREMGIRTVAVYSTADENSLHVKFADEAVCIGGPSSIDSYLNIPRIISAVEITDTQAIHPGYGYLSENHKFAQICVENDIIFIGPKANTINAMGNKLSAILQMKALGVPTIAGSYAILNNLNCAIEVANNIGYPVLLKAVSGGGGKGIVAVYNQGDLQSAWDKAKREALVSFASDDLYMEKYITDNVRHIEVQVLADQYGTIIPFIERDCSIQRRNQKLIEETPSPFISQQLRETLLKTTKESLTKIGYLNSGTVEYLVDDQENYYFMEMNTRLQVEHTITEMVHNVNIVKNQIEIAEGYRLNDIRYNGTYALECRINAEDPENGFKPSCGTITTVHIPTGFGVRVDTHIYTDYNITPYYDSLLAKVITFGNSHEECIARMKRALDEFIIEGVKTTIQYCKSLL